MLLKIILLSFGAFHALALPFEKNDETDSILTLPVQKYSVKKGDPSYLLPDNAILPENYKLTIDVSNSFIEIEKMEFFGDIEILVTVNKENLKEIILHSVNIEIIGDIRVNGEVATFSFDEEREFLKITLAINLTYGLKIVISISYKGKLNDYMSGFFVSRYTENDKDMDIKTMIHHTTEGASHVMHLRTHPVNKILDIVVNRYILATDFQPTYARTAFPCFDEPKYKATFDLTFKKETQYLVMSNSYTPNNGLGSDTVSFPVTPKMSTYLVAFIISEFQYKESPYDKEFKVWSRPNAISQTEWAANCMYNITNNLNAFTGIQYNEYLPKMDMASIPGMGGAMENWGMITYGDSVLLIDDEFSIKRDFQQVTSIIAHEIAHQWFGNLVTCHWWKNTWLNEGFATYFEYHTPGNVFPEWEMKDQFVLEILHSVLGLVDSFISSSPLTVDVYTPQEISNHFGLETYLKGGSVIRMMEHIVGSDIFQQGLQNYLNKNRLHYTEPEDLFSAIQEVIDDQNVPLEYSLGTIMSNWISLPGYPVINVSSVAPGIFALSQQRFFLNLNISEDDRSIETWFVPISYTTSKDLEFDNLQPRLWLTPNESRTLIEVDNDADFIIVNLQQAGYYRVNYEPAIWRRIAKTLATKGSSVHHINKAQIIDDVMNLAISNLVDYETVFNVTDFLAFETGYFPWYAAFTNFYYLLVLPDFETGLEVSRYLRELMQLLLEDKEFVEINESQIETFNRVQALRWACILGEEKCISQATDLFQNYKENGASIPRNLRSVVYCTAVRYGSEDDWHFLWNKYNTSNSETEKNIIARPLGCIRSTNILKSYLEKSIHPERGIRKQDVPYVFEAVYSENSEGVEVAFEFFLEKYRKIVKNYNSMNALEKAVLELARRVTDKAKIEQFKKLLYSSDFFITFRDTAIEIMSNNIVWREKYSGIIKNILIQKRNKKYHE